MKVEVDQNCIGCGFCTSICPDVFFPTDDGKVKATEENVPDNGEAMVIEARTNCPVNAIRTSGH